MCSNSNCQHLGVDHIDGRCKYCACTEFAHPRVIERVDLAGQKYVAIAPTPVKLTSDISRTSAEGLVRA